WGQCVFDGQGLVTNTNDPSCRDARFEITANQSGVNFIALGYEPPIPEDSLQGIAGFRTYASLHAQHQAMVLGSDTLAGQVVGQTLSGRDIWAYVAGDDDRLTPEGFAEAAVMMNGGIHAREWQSPEAVTEVLEQLVEKAGDGGVGQYLADALTVIILPVHNVDGFLQTQAFPTQVAATQQQPRDGRMRRKNLRGGATGALVDDTLDTSDDQWLGVDLNRNSVHGFGLNGGSSDNPISLVYRGASPASEPETQALQAAAALGPGSRLRFYVDAHSFTRQFFVPSTNNLRRNVITNALAARLRAASGSRYLVTIDPIDGEIGLTSNYFAQEFDIPSWTLEIEPRAGGQDYGGTGASHSGFVLPSAEVPRMRDEIATMQLLGFYRQAGPPSVKAVQITRGDSGAVAFRADWTPNAAAGTRTLAVSTDEPLVAGDSYRLWVSFTKPMRIADDNGDAAQYAGQTPQPLGSVSLDAGPNDADDQVVIAGDLSNWLGNPGGAPDGYDTYAFDAFSVEFSAPAVTQGATYALSLDVLDMSMLALDADPATAVDWGGGHWTGYDDEFGESGDVGGDDCQITVRAAPAGGSAPAGSSVACKASFVAPAPAPAPAPIVTPQRSGGGGALAPLWLALLLLRKRRQPQ
ncbi:MAG: M14 family zinc carboxypeptidase, partial [Pseudomonadota bacterium]